LAEFTYIVRAEKAVLSRRVHSRFGAMFLNREDAESAEEKTIKNSAFCSVLSVVVSAPKVGYTL